MTVQLFHDSFKRDPTLTPQTPTLLVSSCLLGNPVRFDGGHKHDRFITGTLAEHFRLRPVCPELAAGLGTPREPIRLVHTPDDGVRVRATRDGSRDVTEPLQNAARSCATQLDGISGVVLKRGSPTCGMERVKIYTPAGTPYSTGAGVFAAKLHETAPFLPLEEEGRLNDPPLRENFLTRVYVYSRWQALQEEGLSAARLVDFHTRHKLLALAHDQHAYRQLGRLVASAGAHPIEPLAQRYFELLMQALQQQATRRQHTNVLQHILGYLRRRVASDDRQHLGLTIEDYRCGLVPLIVPVTLLKDYFRRCPDAYIARQYYLDPYPSALMLRNAI